MAYAKRLQIEYKDINNTDTRIEVWQDGYAGAVKYLDYADDEIACEVVWGDSSTKKLPLVYGSKATFFFDSETDFEFLDFFTSNSRKNKVLVYKNSSLFHAVYGEADTWEEPLVPAPYAVQFTGYDGLGLLKDEDFLQTDKTEYAGEKTPLAILQLILSKTGLDLPLNTAVSIRPSGSPALSDALTQVLKDVITYKEMSCYEVLEALFNGCRIFQRNGEWWVISNDKWSGSSITCYHYTAAGVADGTVTIPTDFSDFWIEGEGSFGFLPALKQMLVKQDYGYKPNLVENGTFDNLESGGLNGWTNVGVTPEVRDYDTDGGKFVYLPGQEYFETAWETTPRTKYLVSDPIRAEKTDAALELALSYAVMGTKGLKADVYFALRFEGDNGVNYILESYVYDGEEGREVRYRFIAGNNILGTPVNATVEKHKPFLGRAWYDVDSPPVSTYPWDEVAQHFSSMKISVPDALAYTGGYIKIYLFLAHSDNVKIAGTCWRSVEMKINNEKNNNFATESEFLLVNDLANNFVPEDISLPNGDLPNLPNNLIIYENGFKLNDGSGDATAGWIQDGNAQSYSYAEIVARFIAAEMKLARKTYQVRVADHIPSTSLVLTDINNNNLRLIEAGITYNDRLQTIEGRYIEVVAFNINGFTVEQEVNYSDSKNTNSSQSGSSNGSKENSVGLISSDYQFEEKSGHLDAEQFEVTTDPVTGRTKISLSENATSTFFKNARALPHEIVDALNVDKYMSPMALKSLKVTFWNGLRSELPDYIFPTGVMFDEDILDNSKIIEP